MCADLRNILIKIADGMKINFHKAGTYVCIEGPRFSTKAESKMFRGWGADIVGMTLVPECVLAREAQMCYASIATVTDYDVWKDHPVTVDEVVRTMKGNLEKVKNIMMKAVLKIPKERTCECKGALKNALV
jgi:5'-methylthioadenosine phosphorylase